MAKSIKDIPKKGRGRPSTGGRREGVMVRLESAQFKALDGWIEKHAPDLSRPEAIRRLVELGLKVKTEAKPVKKPGRGCALRSSPRRRSRRLSIPRRRPKSALNASTD